MKYCKVAVAGLVIGLVAGCSLLPTGHSSRSDQKNIGDLFIGDGTASKAVESPAAREPVADSGLRVRKARRGNMDSYVVRGQRYHTMDSSQGYSARGLASWYGPNFHGRTASSGEVYDMYKMTAAHKTLPLPTYARVTHIDNGKSVIVKINDRGPFSGDRIIDLSFASALQLGMVNDGTAMVEIQALSPEELVVMSGPKNTMNIEFEYAHVDPDVATTAITTSDVENNLTAKGEVFSVDAAYDKPDTALLNTETLAATKVKQIPVSGAVDAETASEKGVAVAVVVPVPTVRAGDSANIAVSDATGTSVDTAIVPLPVELFPAEDTTSIAAVPEPEQVGAVAMVLDASAVSKPSVDAAIKKAQPKPENSYYIQTGVYADAEDAERMAVDVVLVIPREEVHVKPLKNSHMYRVTVGPIIQGPHAKDVSASLTRAGIENYTVKVKAL